jgi:hypothetical protein
MRRLWVMVVVAVVGMAAFQAIDAQVRTIDPERLLSERFGFSADEVSRARSGQAVAKAASAQRRH